VFAVYFFQSYQIGVIVAPFSLDGSKDVFVDLLSFWSNALRYSWVLASIYARCLSIFFWLKFDYLPLCALDLVPSVAMVFPEIKSASFRKDTESLKSCFKALGLSFIKSAIE
jgi:hypothetical protein